MAPTRRARYSFDVKGNLEQVKAASVERVSLERDLGQLITVTAPQGRSLNLQYLDRKTAKACDRFRGVQYIDTPVGRFNYIYGSAKPAGSTIEPVQLLANLVKVTAPGQDEAHRTSRLYHHEDPTLLTGISISGTGSDGKAMHQRIGTYAYDEHGKANLSVKGEPARLQTDKDGKPLQPYWLVEGTGIEQVVLAHSRPGKTIAHNSLGQTTVFSYAEIAGQARLLEVRGAGCAHCAGPNVRYGYDTRVGKMENCQTFSNPVTPNLPRLDAAIIDLDGTMIDTLGDFHFVLSAVLDELQLPRVDRAFVEISVGKGSEHLIRSTLLEVGGELAMYDVAWSSYQSHYQRVNGNHAHVYPGVVEGLDALTTHGLKLACVTNKPIAFASDLLRMKGLASYFSVIFGGDSFERKKPDPLPLIKTCEALGTLPACTLMLGDSSNDARSARAAGCPVVLVTYGYNHGEPICEVDADGFIDRLDELQLDWQRSRPATLL